SRGVTVLTALEVGLSGTPDEDQLRFAAEHGCVLYSHNTSDFYRLHTEWISTGRGHAGMILAPQQRFSVGEQLRRIPAHSGHGQCREDAEPNRVPHQLALTARL
ncbi:MAG: DUF5615 family PIN-like protein, partial [Bryobacterales bacterium]|nr:DUF5615 family PIN-like protein [Bryobacterales bacterium]